ncbi:hypothetical protein HQ590_08300, partial [bacterium]|nr:hypothetical protein [bacterium]
RATHQRNWFKAGHHRSPYAGYAPARLDASGFWLSEWINKSTQAELPVLVDAEPQRAAIILSLARNYPEVAEQAGLSREFLKNGPMQHLDSFCIVSTADRLYLLGRTELGCRHAIAYLLRHLGYRFFNPAPRWCIAPRTSNLAVDLNISKKPALFDFFYNNTSGHGVNVNQADNALWLREMYWGDLNFLTVNRTGLSHRLGMGHVTSHLHEYLKAEFAAHPEYYVMLENGERSKGEHPIRFCLSNPRLMGLMIDERLNNPNGHGGSLKGVRLFDHFNFLVSCTLSAAQACYCPGCQKLGKPIDQLFYYVNQVARAVRKDDPLAHVGVIVVHAKDVPDAEIEPNVVVDVPPRHIDKWRAKVKLLKTEDGLGDLFALPGRGGCSLAHIKETTARYLDKGLLSLSFCAQSNWGQQTPYRYLIARMVWDRNAYVDALYTEFLDLCFAEAAPTMRKLYAFFETQPDLAPENMLTMYRLVDEAYERVKDDGARARIADLMIYLHYLTLYREVDLVLQRDGKRSEAYYDALFPMMQYVAKTRGRMMLGGGAIGYAFCNRAKVYADNRPDWLWQRWVVDGRDPVWMPKEFPFRTVFDEPLELDDPVLETAIADEEIVSQFREDLKRFSKGMAKN